MFKKTVSGNLKKNTTTADLVVTTKVKDNVFIMLKIVHLYSLLSFDSHNRLSPSSHRFVSSCVWLIPQNINTVCVYFVSSTNPV